jgi:hypothetical protein
MAIFNSYVKLPEGILMGSMAHHIYIYSSTEKGSVMATHPGPLDATRRPWVQCPAAVHSFASTGSGENGGGFVMGVPPAMHFFGRDLP